MTATTHTLNRRQLAVLLTVSLGGTSVAAGTALAQDQVIEPVDATPPSLCLSGEGDECVRGSVPATLEIEAIGIDAPIEILETVQGVMQQPSDEFHVAWYKEFARLGETGNMLLAGHVNWWGIPEAVFFNLGTLQEQDAVVLRDEAGTAYRYAIEWVRQESNLEPPREEVLGMTNYEAVTLMTCSGAWNSEISEYDSRTVARAILIDVIAGG